VCLRNDESTLTSVISLQLDEVDVSSLVIRACVIDIGVLYPLILGVTYRKPPGRARVFENVFFAERRIFEGSEWLI